MPPLTSRNGDADDSDGPLDDIHYEGEFCYQAACASSDMPVKRCAQCIYKLVYYSDARGLIKNKCRDQDARGGCQECRRVYPHKPCYMIASHRCLQVPLAELLANMRVAKTVVDEHAKRGQPINHVIFKRYQKQAEECWNRMKAIDAGLCIAEVTTDDYEAAYGCERRRQQSEGPYLGCGQCLIDYPTTFASRARNFRPCSMLDDHTGAVCNACAQNLTLPEGHRCARFPRDAEIQECAVHINACMTVVEAMRGGKIPWRDGQRDKYVRTAKDWVETLRKRAQKVGLYVGQASG